MVDFEMAMMNDLHEKFTNVEVTGCFFHFSQEIWRQIQGLGALVINRYNTDPEFLLLCELYRLLYLS